jgi:Bacterial HORMA domain 2
MTATYVSTYSRIHTAAYASDKMRNLIKLLVQHYGLDPTALVDAWSDWVDRAARQWLESGHLQRFIIEFYKPGTTIALGRWDFPIRYDGNGVDEMWVDRQFLQQSFDKPLRPPTGCIYRILLLAPGGAPVSGVTSCAFHSLNGLAAREAGTVIATPDIMASMVYYK